MVLYCVACIAMSGIMVCDDDDDDDDDDDEHALHVWHLLNPHRICPSLCCLNVI